MFGLLLGGSVLSMVEIIDLLLYNLVVKLTMMNRVKPRPRVIQSTPASSWLPAVWSCATSDCPRLRFCQLTDTVRVTNYRIVSYCLIGPETISEKCFHAPIENALCRCCQFGIKWGENRGHPYWTLTPNEWVLSFQVPDVWAKFRQTRVKNHDRENTDRQTDRQTDTHRE